MLLDLSVPLVPMLHIGRPVLPRTDILTSISLHSVQAFQVNIGVGLRIIRHNGPIMEVDSILPVSALGV
jgi:hypothetical protein